MFDQDGHDPLKDTDSARRGFLKAAAASLFLLASPAGLAAAAASVLAVRVWPAKEYTRVTIEYSSPIQFNQFIVKNPERLVVDLEGVELNAALSEIASKVALNDPYIKLVRAGKPKPGVARLVLDLKTEVKPQVFTLPPVGEYSHRLVIDLYPANPADPLLALLDQGEKGVPAPQEAPREEKPAETEPAREAKDTKEKEAARSEEKPAKGKKGKQEVERLITITLDAGHGGEDPGAVGRGGTYEKNVTLAIARKLQDLIENEPNMRAVLTRDGDYFIPLHQRVAKARKVRADLFVSIHADAFITPQASGSSVFALSEHGATSTAARWLAKKENDADLIGGVNLNVKDPYLARTLLDLSQTATINDSLKLGKAVLGELEGINRLHKGHVEQAGFAVLKAPDIPSILVETAFISNPEEERKLKDDAYQAKMAKAIFTGIKRYFAKNPPLAKSRLAQND